MSHLIGVLPFLTVHMDVKRHSGLPALVSAVNVPVKSPSFSGNAKVSMRMRCGTQELLQHKRASTGFMERILQLSLKRLDDPEPRVRIAVATVLGALSTVQGPAVWLASRDAVLGDIRRCWVRLAPTDVLFKNDFVNCLAHDLARHQQLSALLSCRKPNTLSSELAQQPAIMMMLKSSCGMPVHQLIK